MIRAIVDGRHLDLRVDPIDYRDGCAGILIRGYRPSEPGIPELTIEIPNLNDAFALRLALGDAQVRAIALRSAKRDAA